MISVVLLLLLSLLQEVNGEDVFKVSSTLGSHMVLQRDSDDVVVWGFAEPNSDVKTTFDGRQVYVSSTDAEGIWRQKLPSTEAGGPYTIVFENEGSDNNITLGDVMFGDVYVCGGQSNMQFSLGGNENATFFANEANNYPNIRLFTVGQGTESPGVPLNDLKTIEQVWTRTSSTTVTDGSAFNYFSAVCYFFGKTVSDSMNHTVPIGLISNNWGGTKVEQWLEPASTQLCGHNSTGELYNAMIAPYTIGPMKIKGFTWYQGESDYAEPNNLNYTCTQTVLIENWRDKFQNPNAFFGIVQLSTWLAPDPILLAELREQQLISLSHFQNVAYATNADRGYGSNIHPPFKEYPGTRLGNAARSIVYDDARVSNWRSPSYVDLLFVVSSSTLEHHSRTHHARTQKVRIVESSFEYRRGRELEGRS